MKNVKGTFIPRNVLILEKLYDLKSRFQGFVNVKTNSSSMNHKLINLVSLKTKKMLIFELVVVQLKDKLTSTYSGKYGRVYLVL